MKTKTFGIKEKDFFQFIKKVNEFNNSHEVIATQTFHDDFFYAIIYFKQEQEQERKEFNSPTEKQINLIKKLGIRLTSDLTKEEAKQLIREKLK